MIPASKQAEATVLQMKPAPPVIRTVTTCIRCPFRADLSAHQFAWLTYGGGLRAPEEADWRAVSKGRWKAAMWLF